MCYNSPSFTPVLDRSRRVRPIHAWYFWLDDTPRPGFLNMAIDSALLALAETDGVGFMRLYRWAPACVSFGRHEPATRRYDRDRLRALGLDAVRRPTGGRAVWHDAELTYAVAAPLATLGTLRESCARVHAMLQDALMLLGVQATLAAPPPRAAGLAAGTCFDATVGGELLVGARKVAGSAQLRTDRALLQHGSLLLGGDQARLAEISTATAVPSTRGSLPLGRRVTFQAAAEAIAESACRWPGRWRPIGSGEPIVEQAAAFADQFRSDAWTWCR
jgi:lipoate-protein ligase A